MFKSSVSEGQVRRARLARRIRLAAAAVTVMLIIYGGSILNGVRLLEAEWQSTSQSSHVYDEILFRLQGAFGYGGFNYHFTNYVRTGAADELAAAQSDLRAAGEQLSALMESGLDRDFSAELRAISALLETYSKQLDLVSAAWDSGQPPLRDDPMVALDEMTGVLAINRISQAVHEQMMVTQHQVHERLHRILTIGTLGLLILPLIGLVTWLMLRFLREHTDANQREKDATAQISTIIDTNPEAMILINPAGYIVRVNAAARRLLMFANRDIVGMPVKDLAPEGGMGVWIEKVMELFSQHGDFRVWRGLELWAVTGEGTRIPIGVSAGVSGEGENARVTMLLSDEAPRRKYEVGLIEAREAAERASRAKSDFLANISHEVRTPINAIIGLSGLAQKTGLNQQQRDYIDKVHHASRRLLDLVNDMLDFARIDAGQMLLNEKPFDMLELLEQISTIAGISAEDKGLELSFRVDKSLPSQLVGDENRFAQAMSALISNAIKFTEKGRVSIEVSASPLGEPYTGTHMCIDTAVTDTGVGIAESEIDNLFVAFQQRDTSSSRRHGGAGLGLAICRSLVEAMGGTVSVESTPGEGSTFRFSVRMAVADALSIRSAVKSNATNPAFCPLMLIDDKIDERETLSAALEAEGYPLVVYGDAEQATAALVARQAGRDRVVAMLIDGQMRGTDCVTVLQRLAATVARAERPLIFVMAPPSSVDVVEEQMQDVPVSGFLEKPIDVDALRTVIVESLTRPVPSDAEEFPRQETGGTPENATLLEEEIERDALELSKSIQFPAPVDAAIADEDARAAGFSSINEEALLDHAQGARVLVVDDNAINRQVARETLAFIGAEVEDVEGGQEALELLSHNAPDYFDLVLMDIQMPGMDGLETTRAIRADGRYNVLPIVALTAHTLGEDRDRCFKAGMNGHLTKPAGAQQMVATLNTWVGAMRASNGQATPALELVEMEASPDAGDLDVTGIDADTPDELDDPALQPVFDAGRLDSLRELSDGFMEQMLSDFRDRYHGASKQMNELISRNEIEDARVLAHTIKGTSGSLGAQRLFVSARALDMAIRRQANEREIAVLLRQFDEALMLTCQSIEDEYLKDDVPVASE